MRGPEKELPPRKENRTTCSASPNVIIIPPICNLCTEHLLEHSLSKEQRLQNGIMGEECKRSVDNAVHDAEPIGTLQKVRQHVKEFVEATPEEHKK